MGVLKYLNPKTYDYGERHRDHLVLEDAGLIRVVFGILLGIMGSTLILVLAQPELRYDSNMDNLPHLLVAVIGSIIGIILSSIHIKDQKILILERRFVRVYIAILFLYLSINQIVFSDAKGDGLFTFFIYCALVVNIMHINPMFFLLQVLVFSGFTLPMLFDYFGGSVGTMISMTSYLGGITFLCFNNNYRVRIKLSQVDGHVDVRKQLEEELQRKTAQVVDGMRREVEIQENVIFSIANLVESRDTDTGLHVKATAYYVGIIMKNLKELGYFEDVLTDEFMGIMVHAAPMHDVGKIMVPDAILKAPRRLTDDEFAIMKTHAAEGARIVRHVYQNIESKEYIECAANIANYHHERYDGKGYPEGLKAENIPLEARIMAVADVFDALVSKRCYKDAFPISEAFDDIERNAGSQFDPQIVEAFLLSRAEIENAIVNESYE